MKKKYLIPSSIILILLSLIYFFLLFNVVSNANTYYPEKSDAIIVLGYSLENGETPSDYLTSRMETSLSLYNEGYAENIIVTGGKGPTDNIPVSVAMRKWFIDNNVPRDAIYHDTMSNNTYENFVFAKEICVENGFESVIIVTNDFHMYRSMTIADEFFEIKSGESAVVPISFKKFLLYLKEPLSFVKYEFISKNSAYKILDKQKEALLLSRKPYDSSEKYQQILKRNETTFYDIKMEYDSNTHIFTGTQTITFRNNRNDDIDNIILNLYHNRYNEGYNSFSNKNLEDIGYINIDSITHNGKSIPFESYNSYVDVDINTLAPNKSITFDLNFTAYIPQISSTTGRDDRSVWAKDFFPIVAEFKDDKFINNLYYDELEFAYNDMSNYKIEVTTDRELSVILPNQNSIEIDGNKKITKMDKTLLRNLSFAILENNKNTSLPSSGVNVSMHHYFDSPNIYDTLFVLENGVSYMNKNIGTYPYKSLKIILVGMENTTITSSSGMIFLNKDYINNPNVKTSLVNALVSQWFGSIILATPEQNVYLSNGLSGLISPFIYNPSFTIEEYFNTEYDLLKENYEDLDKKILNTYIYDFTSYNNYYYTEILKPTIMMYSLYNTLDDNWIDFLRYYYKTYSFTIVGEEDFTITVKDYSDKNLNTFFDNWLNKEELFEMN